MIFFISCFSVNWCKITTHVKSVYTTFYWTVYVYCMYQDMYVLSNSELAMKKSHLTRLDFSFFYIQRMYHCIFILSKCNIKPKRFILWTSQWEKLRQIMLQNCTQQNQSNVLGAASRCFQRNEKLYMYWYTPYHAYMLQVFFGVNFLLLVLKIWPKNDNQKKVCKK